MSLLVIFLALVCLALAVVVAVQYFAAPVPCETCKVCDACKDCPTTKPCAECPTCAVCETCVKITRDYTKLPNTKYSGVADIGSSSSVASPELCQALCDMNKNCTNAAYKSDTTSCWLYDNGAIAATVTPTYDTNYSHYYFGSTVPGTGAAAAPTTA